MKICSKTVKYFTVVGAISLSGKSSQRCFLSESKWGNKFGGKSGFGDNSETNISSSAAVVVTQLAEQSFPTPEDSGSNSVYGYC